VSVTSEQLWISDQILYRKKCKFEKSGGVYFIEEGGKRIPAAVSLSIIVLPLRSPIHFPFRKIWGTRADDKVVDSIL